MRRSSPKWSDEDDERLLQMAAAKRSHIMIGVALRRTSKAVNRRLQILRQISAPPTADPVARAE
jgi:hypothetical protein